MPGFVWGFAAVAVPFVVTPGASTAVVLRNSLAGGVRSGVATALGVNAGSMAFGLLTAFGVSVALQRWPGVWIVLRLAGVGYLAWLGARSLWRALSGAATITAAAGAATITAAAGAATITAAAAPSTPAGLPHAAYRSDAREGFLTNALNPSIATFYLLILPQFIPVGAPFARSALLLSAVHVGLALTWHLTWAAAGGTLAHWLGRSRPRRILEGITGVALLALSLKLLL